MKFINLLLVIMAALLIAVGLSTTAVAFHDGGVAHCDGCHTMHNSQDGKPITSTPSDSHLLKQIDSSSTCLACHADYGQRSGMGGENSPEGGSGYGSGGDFYWLTRTFTWTAHGHEASSTGDSHGHNIIAQDFGLTNTDGQLGTSAPGGTFVGELSCASCHDPHGKGDAELLLRNAPYEGANFPAAPIFESAGRRTASSNSVSDTRHSSFGSGMSEWCGACHGDFTGGLANRMHPTSTGLSGIADNYNSYVSTANPDGGSATNAYRELVPFENGATTVEGLAGTDSTQGPTGTSRVMCLSCHRAHASAFPDSFRWDYTTEILQDSHPNGNPADDGSTAQEKLHSYYGVDLTTAWGPDQRSLCNKCHKQDGAHSG